MSKTSLLQKNQLKIFLIVAFAMPYLMGILMGYAFNKGIDVSCFPNTQMYYPSAGIMIATLMLKKGDKLVPRGFYICFITLTVIMVVLTIMSILVPGSQLNGILNFIIIFGSVVSWICLLTETKENREAYGLNPHNAKSSAIMVLLFVALYFGRIFLSCLISGQLNEFVKIFQNSSFYISLIVLPINFFLSFTAFFGEEYGWRYYLTPLLQKRFGKVKGVLLLGILWGLWHLPINVFYYSPQTWLQSILCQQIICISFAIFFSYTYMKTNNIWVPVILHFLNNNMIVILSGGDASIINNQVIGWIDLLVVLILNLILFVPFIWTIEYRRSKKMEVITEEEVQ